MGAGICQHFALNGAARLRGLVLSSAWAAPNGQFRSLIAKRRRVLETEGPAAYLAASSEIALPPAAREAQAPDPATLAARAAKLDIGEELARLDALSAHDLGAEIGTVDLPVELLAAADDQLTPPAMTEDLAGRLPRSRLTMLPRGGHLAPRANAAEFSAALLRSLARLLPPAA